MKSIVSAFILLALATATASAQPSDAAIEEAVTQWSENRFDSIAAGIDRLAASADASALQLLRLADSGALYVQRDSGRLVIAERQGAGYRLRDPLSGDLIATVGRRDVTALRLNNRLRLDLRQAIARAELSHPDAAVRRQAVDVLSRSPGEETLTLLRERLPREDDASVRRALGTTLARVALAAGDEAEQLEALASLRGLYDPEVRNALAAVVDAPDVTPAVAAAAREALTQVDARLRWYRFAETLFYGLSAGSVLVLAAIGLAVTFGVMGVINMAHGELIMLGAYTTFFIQWLLPDSLGVALLLSVPAAFLVAAGVGVLLERTVIRRLYGRPLETLLATFGVSLVLQQLARTLVSSQNVTVANPSFMSGALHIDAALSLTYNRLYIIFFCLAVVLALQLVLHHTRFGLQMRAVVQNRAMARAMGVRSGRTDALTFGLGSGIAGVAGVALSQITNVGPNLGQAYIIDAFLVTVVGGVGNLWGALVGGFGLGIANKFLEPWVGAVLAKILLLVAIVLFMQSRPRGLFPQRGRAVET